MVLGLWSQGFAVRPPGYMQGCGLKTCGNPPDPRGRRPASRSFEYRLTLRDHVPTFVYTWASKEFLHVSFSPEVFAV